ncbi:O-antigen ligase family protein [Nocardioides daphniae]|uniref:O-antigen ligase family protein n=1 Tax=Nocardioides daphniae TaxID=402297 RepID=UPI0016646F42|nr:O-antigen ligase family protein [Nocardioides daphniae]
MLGVPLLDSFGPDAAVVGFVTLATFFSAAAGSHRLTYFFVAASAVQALTVTAGVPGVVWTGMALAGGVFFANLTIRRRTTFPLGLATVTALVGGYWLTIPPTEPSAVVAAVALITLPAYLLLLRMLPGRPDTATPVFAAAGLVATVLPGAMEALGAVLADTAGYSRARVFESAIGTSNYAAGLAAAAGVAAFSAGRARSRLLLLMSLPLLAAPFALASRGALIGEVAALALLFFLERKGGVAAALKPLAALLAGTVLVFVAAEQQWFWFRRFTQPGVNTDYTSGRTDLWSFAVDQWETSLIFGLGPGGGTSDMLARTAIAYPHNFVLAWLIQVGLVGTLVLMVVLCPRPLRRWTVAAAPLVAITIHSMIEPMIETPVGAVFFAVLLAAHGIPSRSQSKDVTS